MLKRAAAEFFGTAFMVSVGCYSVILGWPGWAISLTFGLAVTLAILAVGNISGAHINPAVSMAFWRSGHLESKAVVPYISAQLFGGLTGGYLVSGVGATTISDDLSIISGWGIEIAITFALMASIFFIVHKSTDLKIIAIWVGATVALIAYLFGPLTGASMNPARSFGPNIFAGETASLPLFFIACTIGAVLASELYWRKFGKQQSESSE